MELVVNKEELKGAVSIVKKALPKVIVQEERSHLLFKVRTGKLSIYGTNNDLKARVRIVPVSIDSEFDFTADPKVLEKLLSKIDGDDVSITFNEEDLTVKVFTKKGSKDSFTTLQSFPVNKMLTFEDPTCEVGPTDREALLFALRFSNNYLAPAKEDQRIFDFININKGLSYAANGSNKMGFLVTKALEDVKDLRVRKSVVSTLISVLGSFEDKQVWWDSNDRECLFFNEAGTVFFSYLNSVTEPPPMPTKHLKAEGPYMKLKKQELSKTLERIIVSMTQAQGSGLELIVGGKGTEAYLDISLVASLKTKERIVCERVDDASSEEVKHVVEYKQFKTMLDSMAGEEDIHLYINDDSRFFKMYDKGNLGDSKYISVSIGGYSKVLG